MRQLSHLIVGSLAFEDYIKLVSFPLTALFLSTRSYRHFFSRVYYIIYDSIKLKLHLILSLMTGKNIKYLTWPL